MATPTPGIQPKTVPVRAPDGSLYEVPASELAQLPEGATIASAEDVHAARLQKEYGTAGGIAKSTAAGAARGLTLGLSDEAARAIGGEETAQELANLKTANPVSSFVGELGGAIAPTLLSGGEAAPVEAANLARGASALSRGVRAVGILPRGVAALGEGAAGITRGIVGEGDTSLGGRILQHAAPMAAQGAAEGAIYGAGGAISEDALGPDHDLNAEKLIASAAHGAVFGGLTGGALGASGGLLSGIRGLRGAPTAEALESVAARHVGEEAAPGLGTALKSDAAADQAAEAYIAKRFADDPQMADVAREQWRQRESSLFDHQEKLTKDVRGFAGDLDRVLEAESKVSEIAFGPNKAKEMAALVPKDTWRGARELGLGVWQETKDRLAMLMADPTRGGSGVAVQRVSKIWEKLEGQLQETAIKAAADKGAWTRELFMDLDGFKRAVGKNAGMGLKPFQRTEAQREFYDLYHVVQKGLENEGVWGGAAAAQREINESATKLFGTREAFASKFTTRGFESKAGNPIDRANPAGIQSHLEGILSPSSDLHHEALANYIGNVESFAKKVEQHYAGGKAEAKPIAEMKGALDTMRGTLDRTAKESALANQLKRAKAEESAAGMGGLFGLAADVGARPLKTLDRLASIERTTKRIDETLRNGVKAFLGPKGGGPTNAELANLPKIPPRRAANENGAHPFEKTKDRYTSRAATVAALASSPDTHAAHMARVTGEIAQAAPNTTAAMSVVASRGVAYLNAQLPGGHIDPRSLTPHLEHRRVSDMEADQWLRRYEAAENPMGVLQDMHRGKLTREAVDTVKAVYPKLYEQMQSEVMTQLADRKSPLAYSQKIQLGTLLDIPTDATMAPEFIKAMQDSYGPNPTADEGQQAAAHGSAMKPVNVSRLYAGTLDDIEEKGSK